MKEIVFIKNGARLGKTSKIFDFVEEKELMRGWVISMKMDNQNSCRKYIAQNTLIEVEEQLFDISAYTVTSGNENVSTISAEHISYKLNEYMIAEGFSMVGTIQSIVQELLESSGADEFFTVGDCADKGTVSFALENEGEVTVRSALLEMQKVGVEVSFNNYKIDMPARIGTEDGKVFKFGESLAGLTRTWSRDDGTTYDVAIADLRRAPDAYGGTDFELGDSVTIEDSILGDTVKRRIVKYTKCYDDPTQDSITLGVFMRDSATNAARIQVDLQNKLEEGKSYNNVMINRKEGFVSVSNDGLLKTSVSGTQGLTLWTMEGGIWVRKGGQTVNGLEANRVSQPGSPVYAEIGSVGGHYGLSLLHVIDGEWFAVRNINDSGFGLYGKDNKDVISYAPEIYQLSLSGGKSRIIFSENSIIAGVGSGIYLELGQQSRLAAFTAANEYYSFEIGAAGFQFLKDSVPVGKTRTLASGERPIFENGLYVGYTT